MATLTGLEPVASSVTGWRDTLLHHRAVFKKRRDEHFQLYISLLFYNYIISDKSKIVKKILISKLEEKVRIELTSTALQAAAFPKGPLHLNGAVHSIRTCKPLIRANGFQDRSLNTRTHCIFGTPNRI